MELIDQIDSLDAEADLQRGLDLLAEVKAGRRGSTLRFYRPRPTMAFGQRDANLPGFAAAAEASRSHGFEPLVRRAGGRAMAYHQGCLVIDHLEVDAEAVLGSRRRFSEFGELFAAALRSLDVDAAVGEIPGEYCPGEFSVHGSYPARAGAELEQIKLVGTAQRVVSGAWLFSSAIVVQDASPLRAALVDVYRELGLDWSPKTAGAAEDLQPGLTVEAVKMAVLEAYGL
ncbi:lipoate--protein ligase [Psychromicrobium lacuslunae]|uniref:Lipoate--protein ligase n=1 Tax=Psychromicrobium lacuslunae TaxID=1618207 RepID=A0A0D4BYD1_9MICC|nr:lipoate--protein ligase [Psychromicrobium lacuslunae]